MGSKSGAMLTILILFGLTSGIAQGQTAPPLDALCQLPPMPSPRAANPQSHSPAAKAERDAQLWRAAIAFEQDRFAESLLALRAVYAAEPSADILFNMGQACLADGRLEDAFALYTRAQSESASEETTARIRIRIEQLRPRLAKALTLKAMLLGSQEKYPEACAAWSRAYDLDPRPLYLLQLADAMRQAGRQDDALVLYERLRNLSTAPDIVAVAERRIVELREPVAPNPQPAAAPAHLSSAAPGADLQSQSGTAEGASLRANRTPAYRKWWFWTSLAGAAVVVGLAVGLGTRAALDRPTYSDLRQIVF